MPSRRPAASRGSSCWPAPRSTSRAPCAHLPAAAQHVGQVGQGLGEIAAGLALHAERDDEKAQFRRVDALGDVPQQASRSRPIRMPPSISAELGADRIADLLGGADDRLADRQAGAQRPDHQVDRVREQIEERRDAPLPMRPTTNAAADAERQAEQRLGISPSEVNRSGRRVATASTPIMPALLADGDRTAGARQPRVEQLAVRQPALDEAVHHRRRALAPRQRLRRGRPRAAAELRAIVNRFEAPPVAPPRHRGRRPA